MQMLFSGARLDESGTRSIAGILGIADLESGELLHCCEYQTPEARRADGQKMQITGYSWHEGKLFACTHNEVLVFDEWPPRAPVETFSIPGFNDLHHCLPFDGRLAVANTGLETIDLLSFSGELEQRWDLLESEPDSRRIEPELDYRKIPDTKPHLRHANHLFVVDGELWSSQLRTENAVCVSEPQRTLSMKVGMPHDGDWAGDRVVFTTTNGHLVFIDPLSPERYEAINLLDLSPGYNQLGWCRGVAVDPENSDRVFVSFSKVRPTRWREFAFRLKNRHGVQPGRVCEYDLKTRKLVRTWDLNQPDPGYLLFQLQLLSDELSL